MSEDVLTFLKSYDFMKLGQAINHENWQVAMMTLQRMQKKTQELEMNAFEKQFMNIRQCILHKQGKPAKDILALIMTKRAQLLNQVSLQAAKQEVIKETE